MEAEIRSIDPQLKMLICHSSLLVSFLSLDKILSLHLLRAKLDF